MIPARHNSTYVRFFNLYSRWMIRLYYKQVRLRSELTSNRLPVLMIGNHFSWWDGFIACHINQLAFRRTLYIMMLEEQLKPRMFLNKAGAYSIRKGSRDALASLNYSASLLENSNNIVVIYPQGEFESLYQFPVNFDKGIEVVARNARHEFQLVFYAALVDFFGFRKPTLSIYLKEYPSDIAKSASTLESSYNDFLKNCQVTQKPC